MLIPLVLGSVLLAMRRWPIASVTVLALAIGTKLWPVMLAPLLLRPLAEWPSRLAAGLTLLAALTALLALPICLAGFDRSSGFVSFATSWSTNSAHYPVIETSLQPFAAALGFTEPIASGRLARAALGAVLIAYSLWMAWAPVVDPPDLIGRACAIAGAVVLLSPAQFPWYVLWVLPLAVLQPGLGWHLAAALPPLYYVAFHYIVRDRYPADAGWIVWAIWVPVWIALFRDRLLRRGGAPAP